MRGVASRPEGPFFLAGIGNGIFTGTVCKIFGNLACLEGMLDPAERENQGKSYTQRGIEADCDSTGAIGLDTIRGMQAHA